MTANKPENINPSFKLFTGQFANVCHEKLNIQDRLSNDFSRQPKNQINRAIPYDLKDRLSP